MANGPGGQRHTDDRPARLSTDEARQGQRSHVAMNVLVISLSVLAIIAVVLLIWAYAGSPGTPG